MRTQRWCTVVGLLAVLGLALASCAPAAAPAGKAPSGAVTPTAKEEKPKYGGILTIRQYLEPPGFDLHQQQLLASRMAAGPAYDGLLEYNPLKQNEIIPDLAQRYEVSKDGKEYTFYLNKDVKFHDGSTLTSEDAKFTLERLLNPPKGVLSPKKDLLASIDRIETPDANTVKIFTKYADASFLGGIALSHHVIYSKKVVTEKGDMKRTVMGTGPFKFVNYDPGVSIEYEKNKNYFRKERPYLDGLKFFVILDDTAGFAAFRTGKVLMTSQGSGGLNVTNAKLTEQQLAGKARALLHIPVNSAFIHVNASKEPWKDVRIRKALHLVANRQAIVKSAWEGMGMVSAYFLPEPYGKWEISNAELLKMPGFRPEKDADIAEAKKLLADAGFGSGLSTEFVVRQIDTWQRTAEVLRDQMKGVGVDLKLRVEETGVWSDRKAREDYGIMLEAYGVHDDDPTAWLAMYLRPGIAFKDKQVDDWMQEQVRAMDPAERKKVVRKIEDRLLELLPVIPGLRIGQDYMGIWDKVRNYPEPFGLWNSHKLTEVWLAD